MTKLLIDPVSLARAAVDKQERATEALIVREPLRTWFVGLLELKAERGRRYSWESLVADLNVAAELVLRTPKAHVMVGTRSRVLSEQEVSTLREFVRRKYHKRSTPTWWAMEHFPELWKKVKAGA